MREDARRGCSIKPSKGQRHLRELRCEKGSTVVCPGVPLGSASSPGCESPTPGFSAPSDSPHM